MISKNKGYKQFIQNGGQSHTKLNSKFQLINKKYQKEINPKFLFMTFI